MLINHINKAIECKGHLNLTKESRLFLKIAILRHMMSLTGGKILLVW